jgi:hypothetical protein
MRCRFAAPDPQTRHTVADFIHSPDNLMAGNDRHLVKGEIALNDVNINAADRANAHFHPDLPRPGPRRVHFLLSQRRLVHTLLLCQDHRAHSWLNSHKGSKTLTGFFTTFYARRAFLQFCSPRKLRMFTRPDFRA